MRGVIASCLILTAVLFSCNTVFANENKYILVQNAQFAKMSKYIQSASPTLSIPSVALQSGGYITQLQTYNQAFQNMDTVMMMSKKEREALMRKNRYAVSEIEDITPIPIPVPFSAPELYTIKALEESRGIWARPYAEFENIPLKNGPDVSNVSYGSYFGIDTEMFEFGDGWKGNVGLYAAYNGSHQSYDGIGIYMNGGAFGSSGAVYKDNYFAGVTFNAGAQMGQASSPYGNYDLGIVSSGVAAKTGYNFEFKDGNFIVQPNMAMSYSFVNTFDYTTSFGAKVSPDPMHAIQLEPGLNLIWNTESGWQPYASVSMAWNLIDKTRVSISSYPLSEMSVKPYVKYGAGIRKKWNDKFALSEQTYIYNGGRNGVGLTFDCKWALGLQRL